MFMNMACFILGAVLGGGLMWYYWRRYQTTDKFRQEVQGRVDQIKNAANNLKDKASNLEKKK